MILLDFIIPPQHFIDCDIFLNILWLLHPCLNFSTLYVMIFVRQFFTFRALRETRLREFISGILMFVSLTVGCLFGTIMLIVCALLYVYPNQFSAVSNTTTECLTESSVSKSKSEKVLKVFLKVFSYHLHHWIWQLVDRVLFLLLDGISNL